MNNQKDVSVVVPVYNSAESIELLYSRLEKVFAKENKNWELILVNDKSKDNSWKIVCKLSEKENVIGINLMNNFGQHNAIMCGLSYAQGKYIITMDDDLQHPPEEIPKLLKTISQGYKVVYGQYKQKQHGFFRDFISKSVNRILSTITGTGYNITSFRIMDFSVVKEIIKINSYNVMIDVLIKDIVLRHLVGHCKVKHNQRTIGKSNYSFKKLFAYAINMIFNYTLWPLRIATIFGFLFSTLSVFLGIFFLTYYITYGIDVQGWTSMILLIIFFSGLILFMLGIFGEYLGKMYLIINKKPQYVIQNVIRGLKK